MNLTEKYLKLRKQCHKLLFGCTRSKIYKIYHCQTEKAVQSLSKCSQAKYSTETTIVLEDEIILQVNFLCPHNLARD